MFCIWYSVFSDLTLITQGEEQIQHKTPHEFDSFEFMGLIFNEFCFHPSFLIIIFRQIFKGFAI
jgi:hypothetical protein